jgi:predicted nucleotidyltransferase
MTTYSGKIEFPALHDPRFPVHAVAEKLEPYLRLIVEKIHPERVVLFGSYAYGEPTEHSDFDLLIVRRGIRSAKASNIEIRNLIWYLQAPPVSFTFLSRTPEEVEEKLRRGSPIFHDIINRGVTLYASKAN